MIRGFPWPCRGPWSAVGSAGWRLLDELRRPRPHRRRHRPRRTRRAAGEPGSSRSTPAMIRRRRACTSATSSRPSCSSGSSSPGTGRSSLVGGATGMVGDPSGKSAERNLLDDATLATNVAGIRAQLSRLLDFDDPQTGAVMTNNADWTRGVGYLEFLRDYRQAPHHQLHARQGLGQQRGSRASPASATPSSRTCCCRRSTSCSSRSCTAVGCRSAAPISTATSRRAASSSTSCAGPKVFGLTAPLLLDSAGEKMGKTSTGERVWLDPERTSPYAFYQYWLNRDDEEAARLLRLFSLRPLAEIDELLARARHRSQPPRRAARARAHAHGVGPRRTAWSPASRPRAA